MGYSIERNLVSHPPSEETRENMELLRTKIWDLAGEIEYRCEDGSEKSLAYPKLEEVTMWAMASLARSDYDNQGGN
jgi:hypothetical protein